MTNAIDAIDFDPERLRAFLDDHFGGPETFELRRISGGQSNPTYFVTHGARRLVLRKQPNGPILKGAHAIDREFRVMRALGTQGVPVPEAIHYQADASTIGTPFYLMKRIDGRVFTDCALPDLMPLERRLIVLAMAEAMAKLHRVKPVAAGLGDYGPSGNYFERQVKRWTKQLLESPGPRHPDLERLSRWLSEHLPPDDGCLSVAHGDFRLGNMMFDQSAPVVAGILDWELSTLGHPLADLGFCCMMWHCAPDEFGGIRGLDIATLGIPTKREFAAHYAECAPGVPSLEDFHVVFALFRFAVIFVGIADRARAGNAADANAAKYAHLPQSLARRGLELI